MPPLKETSDIAAFLMGKIPKTATGRVIRRFINTGIRNSPKSPAFRRSLLKLKSQVGKSTPNAMLKGLGTLAVGLEAGLAAHLIKSTSKQVNKDIERIGDTTVKKSNKMLARVKASQKRKRERRAKSMTE